MGSVTNEALAQVSLKLAPYNHILLALLMNFKINLNKLPVVGVVVLYVDN